jgi:hypothetical protein
MRGLWWTAALALAAASVLAACGGGDGNGAKAFPTSSDPAKNIPAGERKQINVVLAGADLFVGDNNFVFGITDTNDEPQGGAKAKATFYNLKDAANPKVVFAADAVQSAPGAGPIVAHKDLNGQVHNHGGQDENRVGYFVRARFDHAGFWGIAVEATLKDGKRGTSNIAFQVFDKPRMPAPGQQALKSDNLTRKDVSNIREIDSGDPANNMHDVKIKDAIAAGRPLVIVFSTPAFCVSRFCGPVTEEVENLQDLYKDRVDFVHIEIWRNFDKKEINQTAKDWLLQPDGSLTEPLVFVVDRAGTIYDRWEGPVAKNIMEASVKAVAEGKLYTKSN